MAQYQVNLAFTADTAKAKAQLKDLQNQLTNLINSPQSKLGIEGEIHGAIKAAAELKAHLQAATNVKTGNLDFSKLSQSLKQSNTSLTQYATKLQQLGPAGQQAFMTLAQSVAQAEIPIRRSSAALDKMWETLKNTARWQVSSTVLHGFMGAVQSAYGYAQDLNKSLNDIRIVTGQNTDQMAKFAKEANKAAKALSTSTTNYTKASLIYYQQGLTDQQVKDRTDITVKMANVARSSAEDVSDQLTAVWNNFYDGSKSLEHYADVMTALGAATASSTDEISEGLNKFAAVAETVGLSYEYAASALATVTATTRESADVVGNAFKTLFARIQGLKLGETLDDGTTLNKYSQALDAVGIQIQGVNGEIKDMDTILNELGAKWDTLGKNQQIALAQTVAGVRQYTQLIALMDNWDYFQENLSVANNSTGALQEQADIYAESWEAASKRVEAAAQSIYEKLINDDFFIDLLNSLEKVLNFTDNLIDSMGGLKGVLMTLSTVATKLFADKMAQGLSNMAYNIKMSTKSGQKQIQQERQAFIENAVNSIPKTANYTSESEKAQMTNLRGQLELQQLLTENAGKMSSIELSTNQALLDRTKILQQQYQEAADARQAADDAVNNIVSGIGEHFADAAYDDPDQHKGLLAEAGQHVTWLQTTSNAQYDINQFGNEALKKLGETGANTTKIIAELKSQLNAVGAESNDIEIQKLVKEFDAMANSSEDVQFGLSKIKRRLEELQQNSVNELRSIMTENPERAEELRRQIDAQTAARKRQAQAEQEANKQRKDTEESIKQSTGAQKSWADTLVASANAIAGFSSALSMMGGIWDTLQDPDLSGWEKFTYIMTTLGMLIPTLVTAWTSLKTVISSETLVKIANAVATWGQVAAEKALNQTKGQGGKITKDNIKQTLSDTKDKIGKSGKNLWGKIKEAPGKISNKWNEISFKAQGHTLHANGTSSMKGVKGIVGKDATSAAMKGAGKTAFKGVMKGLGSAAATAGAVVAALAVAKEIYQAADRLYRKDEIAAEKAEGVAKRLAEQAEKAKAEYEELKNAIDAYDSSISGLENLTAGTVEYADAVATANEHALDLIDTYDELAGQYEVTTEGLIIFNEAALDNLQILELQKRNTAQAAALMAKQNARDIRTAANTTEMLREDIHGSTKGISDEDKSIMGKGVGIGVGVGAVGGAALGVKLGASLGTLAGPIGTAIGAVAGAVLGLAVGGIVAAIDKKEATDNEKKGIDAIYKLYDKIGSAALTKENITKALQAEGITDPELIESLSQNREALQGLMQEMAANTAATRAENEMMARNTAAAVDSNFNNYDTNMQAAITKMGAKRREWIGGRAENNFDKSDYRVDYWLGGWRKAGADEKVKTYLEDQLGIDPDDIQNMNFRKDTVTYNYLNKETGKYEKRELDYDDLAAWENAGIVEEDAQKYYAQIKDAMFAIAQADKSGGLIEILGTGDVNSLSKTEVEKLQAAFSSGEFKNELEKLYELTGTNYTEVVRNALMNWDYEAALTEFTRKVRGEMEQIFAKGAEETGVSAQALENYSKALMKTSSSLRTYADEWERLEDEKAAAEIAVINAKFVKGVQSLNKVYEENLEILQEWNEGSLETWEAVASIQEALEQAFGIKVSADFVKKNLKEIGELAEGDVTHLEELRLAAARDFVINLDIPEDSKTLFEAYLLELNNMAQNGSIEIGASIDDSSYVEQLNKMLEAGQITKEQVQSMFAAIGYSVDLRTTKKKVQNVTHFEYSDQNNNKYSGTYTTTQEVDVPYVAGEDTADPGSGNIGAKSSGSGFTYHGTASTGADLLSNIDDDEGGNKKELDRYHYISRALEDVESEYDAISQARERAFGVDKLALYDREISKLEEVKNTLQAYADEAKAHYESDRYALLSNYGAKLDEEGNITNYEELFAVHGQDEQFSDLVSNYENSLDTWKGKLQEVIDKNNELLDLSLEKIQYKMDMSLKVDEQTQEYLDFLIEMADDPLDDAAMKLNHLTQQLISSQKAATELGEALHEALGESGWSDSDIDALLNGENVENLLASNKLTETQIEMLEQYRDQLYTTTRMLMTWADDVRDTVTEAFDKMGETFDESAEKLSHYNKILDTYSNIIDIVGKDTLGVTDEMMAQLSRDQVNNAMASLQVAKTAHDTNVQALEDLRNSYNENWSDDAKKAWDEAVKHAEEKCRESEAEMFSTWEEALQAAAEAFEKAVETAVAAYEKAMSGLHGSFDAMQTAYDQQSALNERYIEDYEKIYQLSKLNRAVQNSIDDTDNVKAKKELAKLQKDILEMSESDAEVSAYQIEHLQKQYELKLAQIALEEAQNAKSQVRMQRDAEGNWSYVYTADEGEVENAQQDYEDKLFALQDFNQQYIQEQSDALMQLQQEFSQAMANIKRENYATEEEYVAALRQTQDHYQTMINYRLEQLGLATTNAQNLYDNEWLKYSETTGYKISKDSDWVSSFNETQIAIVGDYKTISDYQNAFKTSSEGLVAALTAAYQQWSEDVDTAMVAAGTSTDTFAKDMSEKSQEIRTDTAEIGYSLENLALTALTSFQGVVSAAADNFTKYSTWVASYIAENTKLINSLNAVIAKKAQAAAATNQNTVDMTSQDVDDVTGSLQNTDKDPTPPKGGGGGGGGGGGTSSHFEDDVRYSIKAEQMNRDGSVDAVTSITLTKDELASLQRENMGYGSYAVHRNGIRYELYDNYVRKAMAEANVGTYEDRKTLAGTTPKESKPANAPPWGVGKTVTFTKGALTGAAMKQVDGKYKNAGGADMTFSDVGGYKFTIVHDFDQYGWIGTTNLPISGWPYFYVSKTDVDRLDGFDTGGYTGSWGSNGRLAMLHQKELVLNAADTENMLKTVELVRKIVRVIDLNAAHAANAFGGLTPATPMDTTQVIEQEVTIHAEFPNANNRTEIEEAFNSLLNRASQFANRKK